jgi:hypothetical protein
LTRNVFAGSENPRRSETDLTQLDNFIWKKRTSAKNALLKR